MGLNPVTAPAVDTSTGQFVDKVFRDETGDHKYVVFVPAGYSTAKKWPVILYLHGAHSRGKDGRAQLVNGLAPAIKLRMATFPFVAVFPQCENVKGHMLGGWTDEPEDADRALKIMDKVEREYSVDRRREILMGTSMGGCGVWEVGSRTADRWQVLVPTDALGRPDQIDKLVKVPVWSFHSTGDEILPIERAREMVAALKAKGGRAYLSEVTTQGHANANVTLTQAALYEWLLDPRKEPKLDLVWKMPEGYAEGLEDEVPFVPGAEISNAIVLRICNDVLESLSYAVPDKAAAQPMAGNLAGMHQTTKVGILPFDVSYSNVQYQGKLEQAKITTQAPDRLLVQLGLRNVTMTLSNLQVNGRLIISAKAGPMQIVIGHRAPVWLSLAIRPRIEDRQWKLDLAAVDFQIPDDNWYVTEPNGVQMRGMQFLSGRISDGLVEGIYSRKGEIEQKVRQSVAGIMPQIESTANSYFAKMIPIGSVAVPVVQPRLKLWPEKIAIDESGMTISLGSTIAQLGRPEGEFKLRKYKTPDSVATNKVKNGMEIKISDHFLPAWTELIAVGGVNGAHATDFGLSEFARLNDREFLQDRIPDLQRFGENLDCNSEFVLVKPLVLTGKTSSTDSMSDAVEGVSLVTPRLQLIVSIRSPGERKWKRCVEIDYQSSHQYDLTLLRGNYSARGVKIAEASPVRVSGVARFADGYKPELDQIDLDGFTAQLIVAEQQAKQRMGGMVFPVNDVDVMGIPLRLEQIARAEGATIVRQQLPGILVTNSTSQPMTYEVRGPLTYWGKRYTLAAGEQQEYQVPYPLTWRSRLSKTAPATYYTLPMGREAAFRERPALSLVLLKDKLKSDSTDVTKTASGADSAMTNSVVK